MAQMSASCQHLAWPHLLLQDLLQLVHADPQIDVQLHGPILNKHVSASTSTRLLCQAKLSCMQSHAVLACHNCSLDLWQSEQSHKASGRHVGKEPPWQGSHTCLLQAGIERLGTSWWQAGPSAPPELAASWAWAPASAHASQNIPIHWPLRHICVYCIAVLDDRRCASRSASQTALPCSAPAGRQAALP